MADMGMYHALGRDDQNPNGAPQQQPPYGYPQQQNQPMAPSPGGYQQGPPPFQAQPPQPGYAPSLVAPPSPYGQQPGPYGPPPSSSPMPPPQPGMYGAPPGQVQSLYAGEGVGGLTQAMAGMDIGPQPATYSKAAKKKHRHAYHEIGQSFEQPPAMGGMPPFSPNVGDNLQQGFLGQGTPSPMGVNQPSSQFPIQAAPQFMSQQPADMGGFRPGSSSAVSSTGGKVDPLSIPSVPAARDTATQHFRQTIFPTLARQYPPNATSDFLAQDQGNASPRFCRLTVNAVPATAELLSSTSLPLALLLQPLAKLRPGEDPVPVLDFGEAGPPRCRRCRTYINPFMQFLQGGGKFRCNMCLFPNNEVPPEYYGPIDMSGVRMDRDSRPELSKGTVEFVVPKEYWAKREGAEDVEEGKAGATMRYLFLVDCTEGAVNRGTLLTVVEGIKNALFGDNAYEPVLEGEESQDDREGQKRKFPKGCKIGICTFDKEIHFYNLNPALEQAQMVVMPDIEEPFVPFHDGLFVDPYASRHLIESLLDSLTEMFARVKNPEPALLPALSACLNALKNTGGKIICSLATIPTWGPHRLVLREDTKLYNTDKEKILFKTEHQEWRAVAGKMVEAGVGIDFFMTPSAYIDVATIGHLSATSGGEMYLYPNFVQERDFKKLHDELAHSLHRGAGYQALLKVRCSTGMQVTSYHGNFLQHGGPAADVEFGVIDEDKTLCVMFSHDGKLDPKVDAHFQSALLYTTKSGERRVRCSNIVAGVTEVARDTIRWADQDALLGVLAREAASKMVERPIKDIRSALTEKCIDILAAYRKQSTGNQAPGQLVLPESLKEFSMFVLALLKTRAFGGRNVSSDIRTHSMRMLKSMSASELQLYLYPRILPIHNMVPEDGFPDSTGHLKLPTAMRASFSFVEDGGAYLVDNGQYLLLWIHSQVSPNLLQDLFGESYSTLQSLDPMLHSLPVLETALNAQVRNIIQYLASLRGSKKLSVQLARQGLDGAEYEFAAALVEDRNNEERNYVDWLVHVHKYIQLEVSPAMRGG